MPVTEGKLISIIMATSNCGPKVEATVRSILLQDPELFEFIVIDNASTDVTLDILQKYSHRIRLISEKDQGVYFAFNKGLEFARGRYIYFIGAGDVLRPGILSAIEHLLTDTPTLLYGNCYFSKQRYVNGREFTSELFIANNICQQGIFYHRKIFDVLGGFNTRYPVFADWLLNLQCFLCPEILNRYIDLTIADYEQGGVSSKVDNDPMFKKDFPRFVLQHFGILSALKCKAFLTEPRIFNHLRASEYQLLLHYLADAYRLPRYLHSTLRPSIVRYKNRTGR
jgi:glycosyltransferase involved in cell wall biosynthesis